MISAAAMLLRAEAQTVLSGDHVVEGNLEVGTTGQKGGLTITGETGSTASPGMKVTGDGGVLFEGTLGQGVMPQAAPGKDVMMWYPGKAAFRIGNTSDWMWNDSDIGKRSVAFWSSLAGGEFSTAISGGGAYNTFSTAMSLGTAEGAYSTAMSGGVAFGASSTAMGGGWAYGDSSTAMGGGYTFGNYSIAISGGEASSNYSTAMGGGYAEGAYSTAMSFGTAIGKESVAVGNVTATAFRNVVVGSFNSFTENESSSIWVDIDPIFVVGNGTGELSDPPSKRNRNALVILKNGDIQIPKRQGDILMGEFGDPEP